MECLYCNLLFLGRSLLALEENGEADYPEVGSGEVVGTSPSPDEIEIVPSHNGSSKHCIQPAVTQFPHPMLDKKTRQQGGVLLHILIAFYMFIGNVFNDFMVNVFVYSSIHCRAGNCL